MGASTLSVGGETEEEGVGRCQRDEIVVDDVGDGGERTNTAWRT